MQYRKLWTAMGLVMLDSFTVLGVVGYKAINNAPPIPEAILSGPVSSLGREVGYAEIGLKPACAKSGWPLHNTTNTSIGHGA